MLEVRGLSVTYGQTEALRGIDLDVHDGEAVALLGPNGAGKTTTLRALSRLVPHEGTISFDGRPLEGESTESVARSGLIHVPEGRRIFPTLTVQENLELALIARDKRPSDFSMADVYDLFPALVPLRGRDGFALSGGEQQMVAIGRGLVAGPRLLLLDEPSLGLAPIIARTVFAALAEIRSRVSMLIVEQNTTLALGVSDRAYVLNAGSVVLSGTAQEVEDRDALLASYLGRSDTLDLSSTTEQPTPDGGSRG